MSGLQHEGERIASSFKVTVLVAVFGLAASLFVAIEVPSSNIAPDEPFTLMAESYLASDGPLVAHSPSTHPSAETAARSEHHASAIPTN